MAAALSHLRRLIAKPFHIFVAALFIALTLNLAWLAYSRGITQDEVIHIPAGYYQVFRRDFQMNNVTPPMIKMIAAAPATLQPAPALPEIKKLNSFPDFASRDYQTALSFWTANHPRFTTILFTSRLGALVVTLALAAAIFAFARQLFGRRAALFALLLFAFEPNVIAHGHIVHADIIAALALTLVFYVLVNYWQRPNVKWTLLLGLAAGFALIAKFTLVMLFGIFLLALAVRWTRATKSRVKEIAAKCGAIISCLLVLNAAYLFASRRTNDGPPRVTSPSIGIAALVPNDYLEGLTRLVQTNQKGHPAFLLGEYSETGWWYYFPVAFGLKTTIPLLLLVVGAITWAGLKLVQRRQKRFIPVFAGLLFYLLLLTTSRINVGVRHLLPAFPFLFIIGGAFLDRLVGSKRKLALACVVVLVGWMGVEAARAWPGYMSYMNQFASRHPRWHYLGDSNIEWGQETSALARYLNARGVKSVRGAMLCGEITLPRYGIEYINLLNGEVLNAPSTEFIAIGANFLNGSLIAENRNWFERYRNRQPEAVFGDSIYLYRFEAEH